MNLRDILMASWPMNPPGKLDSSVHLRWAGEWLLEAQTAAGGGGYAHSYSLVKGWRPAYPETTGYTIETLLRLSETLDAPVYRDSALKAGEWLLKIQNKDGSYNDLSGNPRIFDTAQILRGLLACEGLTGDIRYLDAAQRGGAWLIQHQEADGSFIRFAYLDAPHSYYIKVAAPLLDLAARCQNERYRIAAVKQIAWVLKQQTANGFFDQAGFVPGAPPYIHTLLYILEGLMESRLRLAREDLSKPIGNLAHALLAADRRDRLLASQYDASWRPALRQRCLPGLAQWANAAFQLYEDGAGKEFLEAGRKTAAYLRSRQIRSGSSAVRGGLPGSVPLWGKYLAFALPNWGVKYLIDALIRGKAVERMAEGRKSGGDV